MLKPAQLYEDELKDLYTSIWYDLDYMYYSMGTGMSLYTLADNNGSHHEFVSVDKDNHVVGVISYTVNWDALSAGSLGIIAFQKMNPYFIKDLKQALKDIFLKYNLNRLSFYAVADNPVVPSYRKAVEHYGGTVCGYEHDCCRLIDGKLHDCIWFEIMAKDFKSHFKGIHKHKTPIVNT